MLQVRRPFMALSPHRCILCLNNGQSIDHLFLHCLLNMELWHKLFKLAELDWVSPKSINDIMTISFRGLGNSIRGKVLWHIACFTLIWIVWWKRNARIFENKWTSELIWDLIYFYSSFWDSTTFAFYGHNTQFHSTWLVFDM